MINEQTVKLKVASTSVEYARWGEITGNIESQTDLMNLLGERDLEEVQEAITQGLDDIDTAKEEAIEEIRQSGGVLTADVKNALLNCFQKVAWIDENGQTYYDALYNALYPPVEVRTLTAVLNASGHTFYVGDSIEDLRAYLTVTAELSTGQTVTVNDYTLSGSLSYAGENIITVTYSGKSTTVTVNAISVELVSISAVYTQSGTVYASDSLDSLKSDLVVTAHYSDSSTSTVASTDYTLSGTLAEGTSVITVAYEGLTTTFNVTVTAWTWMYKASDGQTLSQRTDLFTAGASAGTLTETISDGLLNITATNDGGQKYWAFKSPTTNTNAVMEMRIKYAQVVYATEYANLQIQLSNGTGGAKVGASRNGDYTATPKFATIIGSSTTWNPDIVIDDWYVVRIKIEDGKQSVYVNGVAVIENQNLCTSYCLYNRIFMQAPNNHNASPSEVYIDYIAYKNYD